MAEVPFSQQWGVGVMAVHPKTRQVVLFRWGGLRRVLWWGWCDCGWTTLRRKKRACKTATYNHHHVTHVGHREGKANG